VRFFFPFTKRKEEQNKFTTMFGRIIPINIGTGNKKRPPHYKAAIGLVRKLFL
jgi:hypothetical protein